MYRNVLFKISIKEDKEAYDLQDLSDIPLPFLFVSEDQGKIRLVLKVLTGHLKFNK
jgi:hypothetical protein